QQLHRAGQPRRRRQGHAAPASQRKSPQDPPAGKGDPPPEIRRGQQPDQGVQRPQGGHQEHLLPHGHGRPLPQRQPEGCRGQPGGDGLFGWFQAIASFFRSFHKGSINENGTPRKRRPASVSQKRPALGGTHFCPARTSTRLNSSHASTS